MDIGVSTACLYPALTEQALDELLAAGVKTLEVFVNAECETEPAFAQRLKERADAAGARIVSLHPYTSASEPYWLFSDYRRRFDEGKGYFERLFRAAREMGASYVVLHGDRENSALSAEETAGRYHELYQIGKQWEVELLQENVVKFRAGKPEFVREMRRILGDEAGFVLDIKQCIRAGVPPLDMIDAMGRSIRHVHISDHRDGANSLLPGEGTQDYVLLAEHLRQNGFSGDWVIELYRHNFRNTEQLAGAARLLADRLSL